MPKETTDVSWQDSNSRMSSYSDALTTQPMSLQVAVISGLTEIREVVLKKTHGSKKKVPETTQHVIKIWRINPTYAIYPLCLPNTWGFILQVNQYLNLDIILSILCWHRSSGEKYMRGVSDVIWSTNGRVVFTVFEKYSSNLIYSITFGYNNC